MGSSHPSVEHHGEQPTHPWSTMGSSQHIERTTSRSLLVARHVLRPSPEHQPIRLDPTQSCAPGRRRDSVSSVSSPRTREVLRHLPACDQHLTLSRMPTNHHDLHLMPPTLSTTNYIHAPIVISSPPSTRSSSASEIILRRLWCSCFPCSCFTRSCFPCSLLFIRPVLNMLLEAPYNACVENFLILCEKLLVKLLMADHATTRKMV